MLDICICHVSIYKHLFCPFQVNEWSLGVYIISNCGSRLINMPTVHVNSKAIAPLCVYMLYYIFMKEEHRGRKTGWT